MSVSQLFLKFPAFFYNFYTTSAQTWRRRWI